MGKSEMGSPAPAQLLDSGLCGLSLVAGYYRIAGDPAQLRHQLALTGRSAQVEDIVRGANVLQLKSRILRGMTAKRLGAIPYPAILCLTEGGCFRWKDSRICKNTSDFFLQANFCVQRSQQFFWFRPATPIGVHAGIRNFSI